MISLEEETADHSAGALAIKCKAFRHTVCHNTENVSRQIRKLFEDLTNFFFFAGIINICYV